MRDFLRPLLEDIQNNAPEELERRRNFLRMILYFGIGATVLSTLIIYVINPRALQAVMLNGLLTLFQIFILLIARRGYQRAASFLLVLIFGLYCAVGLYSYGGIRNPLSTTLMVLIMIAATLLGQLGVILAIILAGGITLWLTLLEAHGALPQPPYPNVPLQGWVAYFSTILAGAVVLYAWYYNIRTAMHRAHQEIEHRKQVEANAEQRIRELEALNAISQILVSTKDITTLMNSIGEKIHTIFDVPIAFIALLDEETHLINFSYFRLNEITASEPIKLGEGMTSQIILRRMPLLINANWSEEARKYNVISTLDDVIIKSSLGVPMIANERSIGVLSLQETRRENRFTEDDLRLLSTIASNVAIAIENMRLQNAAQQELKERKLAEAALRESEERYRIISSVSSDYTFMTLVDENGAAREEWVSDAFETITGYTHVELIAMGGWIPIVHPDDRAMDRQSYEKLLANQRVIAEMRIIRKDGATRWVRMYAQPIWDKTLRRVSKFYGAVQDITERKLAEDDMRKSEARLRAVLDNIPYDLWVCDETGRYIMQNIKGDQAAADAIGKTPLEIENVPLELRQRWHAEHLAALSGQKVRNEYIEYDQAGNKKIFIVSVAPIYNHSEIIGLVGLSVDVTELKLVEDEVRILNAELEKKVEMRTAELETTIRELEAFSYNISHYVRAPLRGIHGYASLLASEFGPQLPETAKAHIRKIQAGARMMDQVINDLLAYNRLGRARPAKTWVDIKDVFNVTLIELLQEAPNRQVETRLADLPPAFADMQLMKVVIHQLLNNAFKFTGRQMVTKIEVGFATQDGKTVYYVKDNGIGFNMKYANKLFKVFQRLSEPDHFEGTGIGLAITERIIQKHGGKIWAEAEPENGATFFFTLG